MLAPNSPRKRLEYALKGEIQPSVILATVEASIELMGLEANKDIDDAHSRLLGRAQQGRDPRPALEQLYPLLPASHPAEWLIPWMHRELSRLHKTPGLTGTDWSEATGLLKQRGPAIAQWAKETRTDIGKVNLLQAFDAIENYKFKQARVPQGEVVYEFPDGWTVQGLRTEAQLGAEGKVMQHCVGAYCEPVEEGTSKIFSLRDPAGNPHVTIEWRADSVHENLDWDALQKASYNEFLDDESLFGAGRVVQVYGKQNDPPAGRYKPYVQEFITKRLGGDGLGMALAGASGKDINWDGVPLGAIDVRRVDLRGADLSEADTGPEDEDEGRLVFGDVNMDEADLSGNDWTMVLFRRVSLRHALFESTKLSGAEFQSCNLTGASFVGAKMRDALVSNCELKDADFSSADLRDADFEHRPGEPFDLDWLRGTVLWDEKTIWPDGKKRKESDVAANSRGR